MSLALFNAVLAGAIEILYDEQNQPWFKQVHVGEFIGITNMSDATSKFGVEDKKNRDKITLGSTEGSYTLPKHAKLHDGFLSVNGVTTVLVNSRKPKARQVTAWLIHDIIPKGFNAIIAEKQQTIEEKETTLALLNDDINRKDIQLRVNDLEIRDLVQNRHVPRIGKYDNILCAIDKNTPEEHHPYYMIRCMRMRLQKRINILRAKYPDMIIKRPEYDAANAVICWVRFKQYIGRENYHRNHFSLDEDSRDVFEDTFDIQM